MGNNQLNIAMKQSLQYIQNKKRIFEGLVDKRTEEIQDLSK